MIWLSNSALKYAVDVCDEMPNCHAVVFVRNHTHSDEIQKKLRTYLKNRRATIRNVEYDWHANFDNGSRIDIVSANDNAQGHRCHIAIVDTGIQRNVIDTVIRPMEILADHEEERDALPGMLRTGGYVTQENPITDERTQYVIDTDRTMQSRNNTYGNVYIRNVIDDLNQLADQLTTLTNGGTN